ncbi:MAG TPA: hypothetical protein VGQ83_33360 [Polyangia bacterium]|jgi:hypothetical protein
MTVHKAVVRDGRLRLDEPTDLPENSEVPLFEADPFEHIESFDELDADTRARLEEALDRGWDELEAGGGLSLGESLDRLRAR